VALGLVAPILGGTNRLINAPCAPAAAVLSAFAIQLLQQGVSPQEALLFLALTGLACGLLQILFGSVRLGQLIKYMPYPVVSGYLSGVGIVIIFSQISLLLGTPKDVALWDVLTVPSLWGWESIVVGLVTIGVMLGAGRVTKAVPAAILGLVAGVAAYFAIAVLQPALLEVDGNPLIVGPLGGAGNGFVESFTGRWSGLESFDAEDLTKFLLPAITLAVLLSIDTLKTCVVLDALTRTRHNSNRELIGQGFGNLASTLVGGMPGAGQMGGTLVNMASGGPPDYQA
jgi:SulP family sulfate permease